ncbi:MAG: thioredoxin domain-containing protein [Pseudomonadales bacterium]
MNEAIIELGYRPKIVHSRVTLGSSTKNETRGAIPEPVASAIEAAAHVNKPLFVDFFAEWCGACKTMDRTTFKDPMVKKALEQFVFLKVDTDLHPATARYFNVIGMPTLVVLDASGGEIYRQVGPIGATKLAEELSTLPTITITARPASR